MLETDNRLQRVGVERRLDPFLRLRKFEKRASEAITPGSEQLSSSNARSVSTAVRCWTYALSRVVRSSFSNFENAANSLIASAEIRAPKRARTRSSTSGLRAARPSRLSAQFIDNVWELCQRPQVLHAGVRDWGLVSTRSSRLGCDSARCARLASVIRPQYLRSS